MWIRGLVASRCWCSCSPLGTLLREAGDDRTPDLCTEPNLPALCPHLTPSRRRMRSRLEGSCSMLPRTRVLHSGHRSSFCDFRILCRQGLQNVCWHGSTFAVASSFSKHTGHSNRSRRAKSSIFSAEPLQERGRGRARPASTGAARGALPREAAPGSGSNPARRRERGAELRCRSCNAATYIQSCARSQSGAHSLRPQPGSK